MASITLYYGTTSDELKKIISDGKICSSKNKLPNDYCKITYYLSHNKNGIEKSIFELYSDLERGIAKLDSEIGYKMKEIYEDIYNEYRKENIPKLEKEQNISDKYYRTKLNIEINKGNNDANIVYLENENIAEQYANQFLVGYNNSGFKKYKNNTDLQFGVILEISVEEENLGPNLNEGRIDESSNIPEWKQTYDSIGQCVYYGDIPIDKILSVMFIMPESMDESVYNETIQFNVKYSLSEATNIINSI